MSSRNSFGLVGRTGGIDHVGQTVRTGVNARSVIRQVYAGPVDAVQLNPTDIGINQPSRKLRAAK